MVEDGQVQAFASLEVLEEIHRVLGYERILRILKRSAKEPSAIMATVVSLTSLVEVTSTVEAIKEDAADNRLLACAKDARAHFLISGDRHLLKLGEYGNVKVLTLASFLQRPDLNVK